MPKATVRRAPHLTTIAPQFLVDDLDAAIAYYCEKLGFQKDFIFVVGVVPDPDNLPHL